MENGPEREDTEKLQGKIRQRKEHWSNNEKGLVIALFTENYNAKRHLKGFEQNWN